MPLSLHLHDFFERSGTLLDVRSPSEYAHGHIPGSFSLPLFSDTERALIGTAYKQQSRDHAIDLGLQIIGPQLYTLVQSAKQLLGTSEGKILCWRGGMRSGFVARLLESIGINTFTLQGGYKSFRRWTLKILDNIGTPQPSLFVLGGLTGSGKTSILQSLKNAGEQILDLESLANHRGSTFGNIGLGQPSTQENFENQLAFQWNQLDLSKRIWIEDESRLIGKCCIPASLYNALTKAPIYYIEIPLEQRLNHLLTIYGQASQQDLIEATLKLMRRLGSQLTQEIISLLNQNHKKEAFTLLLSYYDRTYHHQLTRKPFVHILKYDSLLLPSEWARNLQNVG